MNQTVDLAAARAPEDGAPSYDPGLYLHSHTSSPVHPSRAISSCSVPQPAGLIATRLESQPPPSDHKSEAKRVVPVVTVYEEKDELFPSIPLSKFHEHVQEQKKLIDSSFDAFDIEMEILQQSSMSMQFQKRVHQQDGRVISKLNRYVDVLPHANTRVCLEPIQDQVYSDYINASHVVFQAPACGPLIHPHGHRYIAASAPLPNTIDSWWRMCWEHNIHLVLMLTKDFEKSKKADIYWPENQRQHTFAEVTVRHLKTTVRGDTIIREFDMTKGTETRSLIHLQYVGWPDHGVPEDYRSILDLFTLYQAYKEKNGERPILTHCSAGIGRTGTFIAIDVLLDYLNVERLKKSGVTEPLINVFTLVRFLRDQRPGMVQSKEQYAFISLFLDYCIQHRLLGVGPLS